MNRKHIESTKIAQQAVNGIAYDPKIHGLETSPNWCVFQATAFLCRVVPGPTVIAEAWNGRGYTVNIRKTVPHDMIPGRTNTISYVIRRDDLGHWYISDRSVACGPAPVTA